MRGQARRARDCPHPGAVIHWLDSYLIELIEAARIRSSDLRRQPHLLAGLGCTPGLGLTYSSCPLFRISSIPTLSKS